MDKILFPIIFKDNNDGKQIVLKYLEKLSFSKTITNWWKYRWPNG